jgi:oligopeptide/dipeptide ABC transporter ATP-binding protein
MAETLIKVENLKKYFPIRGGLLQKTVGHVKAVDGISLEIKKGETLGIVGESGCGKSTAGRTILRLQEKTEGNVFFQDKNIFDLDKKSLRSLRPEMQIIFQDPYSSLNPRLNVGQIVGEALGDHGLCAKGEIEDKVMETILKCGLSPYHIRRFPHEFSGGQRQRIGIARALIMNPKFIVCDEPVSALDVSIQAQIVNLLADLQAESGFSYMFISHDLSVIRHISHRVGVMYLGSMVELAPKQELYSNPVHPYTKALLSAVPIPDPTIKRDRILLQGDLPSPANPPSGCKFHTRCPYKMDKCSKENPEYKDIGGEHFVACHLV